MNDQAKPRIYISGPITQGDRNHNYYQACKVQKWMMLNGFAPLNPMMTMVLPFAWESEITHDLWLECDFPWIECSDAIFRLQGHSIGADKEVAYAEELHIPEFHNIYDLTAWRNNVWLPHQKKLNLESKALIEGSCCMETTKVSLSPVMQNESCCSNESNLS